MGLKVIPFPLSLDKPAKEEKEKVIQLEVRD